MNQIVNERLGRAENKLGGLVHDKPLLNASCRWGGSLDLSNGINEIDCQLNNVAINVRQNVIFAKQVLDAVTTSARHIIGVYLKHDKSNASSLFHFGYIIRYPRIFGHVHTTLSRKDNNM